MNLRPMFCAISPAFPLAAGAEVLRCTFTDPFHSTVYDFTARTLTITGSERDQPLIMQRVAFTIRGPGAFTLAEAQGKLVQRLMLSGKGSDGMSDRVYPYEVHWFREGFTLTGACVSEVLRAKGKP